MDKRSSSLDLWQNAREIYQAGRRRALIHRARAFILLLSAFCLSAGTIYLSSVIVGIRLITLTLPDNELQSIVRAWRTPEDSLQLLEPFPLHFSEDLVPVPCHSHNDYSRRVPLFQALAAGCTSIEADLYLPSPGYIRTHGLRDEDLLVAHSRSALRPDRTLRALYTEPLLRMLTAMNNASSTQLSGIFSVDPAQSLTLLLDFKETSPSALSELWNRVQAHIAPFRLPNASFLTASHEGTVLFRPLTVVVTGAAPFDFILNWTKNPRGDIFFDAPLHDLYPQPDAASPYNGSNSYFASTSLKRHIGSPSLWSGHFSTLQLDRTKTQIGHAKELELIPRYWGTSRWPVGTRSYVWSTLWKLGVGVLNVDEVDVAARWNWEPGTKLLGCVGCFGRR